MNYILIKIRFERPPWRKGTPSERATGQCKSKHKCIYFYPWREAFPIEGPHFRCKRSGLTRGVPLLSIISLIKVFDAHLSCRRWRWWRWWGTPADAVRSSAPSPYQATRRTAAPGTQRWRWESPRGCEITNSIQTKVKMRITTRLWNNKLYINKGEDQNHQAAVK